MPSWPAACSRKDHAGSASARRSQPRRRSAWAQGRRLFQCGPIANVTREISPSSGIGRRRRRAGTRSPCGRHQDRCRHPPASASKRRQATTRTPVPELPTRRRRGLRARRPAANGPAKTRFISPPTTPAKGGRHLAPRRRGVTSHRHGAQRLIIETQVDLGRIDASLLDQRGECFAGIAPSNHRMKRDRNPGIDEDAVKQPLQGFRRGIGDTKASGTRPAGKFDLKSTGAVLEFMDRQRIGSRGSG